MSGKLKKTRAFGAFVIAMSLISNSVYAANAQVLSVTGRAPAAFTEPHDGADVLQVQHRRGDHDRVRDRDGRRFDRRDHRRFDRSHDRRADRRDDRWRDDRRGGDTRYRHGYRGYRDYRPGYRRDNDGWWFPLAAFALGAVILGQQSRSQGYSQSQTQSYGGWNHIPAGNMAAHDSWCDQRYRSYSRSTKTFQPYSGPRRFCNSPYDRL